MKTVCGTAIGGFLFIKRVLTWLHINLSQLLCQYFFDVDFFVSFAYNKYVSSDTYHDKEQSFVSAARQPLVARRHINVRPAKDCPLLLGGL